MGYLPVPDTSTEHVIKFLRDQLINIYSYPKRLISDQGPCFTSKQMAEKMKEWRLRHILVTAEHAESNRQVERVNASLTATIKAFVNMEHTNWDSLLPDGIYAINNSVQSTTEVTPFELYGYPPVQKNRKRVRVASGTSRIPQEIHSVSGEIMARDTN